MIRLCQSLKFEEPHSPLENPDLTGEAVHLEGKLEKVVIRKSSLTAYERMAEAEAALLGRWTYSDSWEEHLDAPLLAHADAALSLHQISDAVVGIEEAGLPYAEIFKMMGFDIFSVDYSHYKRSMDRPLINEGKLTDLKEKKNILLVDVDIVSGKTIRTVSEYLWQERVNVIGVYCGLSRWPGLDIEKRYIGSDNVDFDKFWKQCGNIRQIKDQYPYTAKIISPRLRLFTSNGILENDKKSGLRAARRVAFYLLNYETKNN